MTQDMASRVTDHLGPQQSNTQHASSQNCISSPGSLACSFHVSRPILQGQTAITITHLDDP